MMSDQDHLYGDQQFFERLQLEMTAEPKPQVTHRAHSYQSAGLDFEEVTFDIYALGPSGVWSTAADLASWANLSHGETGRTDLQARRLEGAPETGIESSRYGAGISSGTQPAVRERVLRRVQISFSGVVRLAALRRRPLQPCREQA